MLFFLEKEKVLEALIAENSEMKTKLKDLETPSRYLKKIKQAVFFFEIQAAFLVQRDLCAFQVTVKRRRLKTLYIL